LGWLLRVAALGRKDFILPHGGAEMPHGRAEITLWIALSVTAGICEETIFRGYLQWQFMALSKSAPAGILLSAAVFGAAHAYQGFRMVILIGLYGAMFGILAYWRGSVRPGIITHECNDSLNGVLVGLSRQYRVCLVSVTGNICVAQWTACEFLESEQGRRDKRKCTPNKLLSWFVRAWR
jgi:membrane protease YdiL (CAAX protease family)